METTGPPRAGQLLIAAEPGNGDFFDRTVVLIIEHNRGGSVGVVLNRPMSVDMPDELAGWMPFLTPPAVPFEGGPVAPQAALGLAQLSDPHQTPLGWKAVSDDIGLVDLGTPLEVLQGAYAHVRIYIAFSGWSPGQLDDELARGVWFRAQARAEDVFGTPEGLWRRVLRRQGGMLGQWSTWTNTPTSN